MKVDFTYDELIEICFLFIVVDEEYVKQRKHEQHVFLNTIKTYIEQNLHDKKYELELSKHYIIELSNVIMDAINVSGSRNMYRLSEQGIDIYDKLNKIILEIAKNHVI